MEKVAVEDAIHMSLGMFKHNLYLFYRSNKQDIYNYSIDEYIQKAEIFDRNTISKSRFRSNGNQQSEWGDETSDVDMAESAKEYFQFTGGSLQMFIKYIRLFTTKHFKQTCRIQSRSSGDSCGPTSARTDLLACRHSCQSVRTLFNRVCAVVRRKTLLTKGNSSTMAI